MCCNAGKTRCGFPRNAPFSTLRAHAPSILQSSSLSECVTRCPAHVYSFAGNMDSTAETVAEAICSCVPVITESPRLQGQACSQARGRQWRQSSQKKQDARWPREPWSCLHAISVLQTGNKCTSHSEQSDTRVGHEPTTGGMPRRWAC